MRLGEILDQLDEHDDQLVIYVSSEDEPVESTDADLFAPPADGIVEQKEGQRYLLEVGLAKEVIRVWSEWREGRVPTTREKCEAVVHYATHDSYLPT